MQVDSVKRYLSDLFHYDSEAFYLTSGDMYIPLIDARDLNTYKIKDDSCILSKFRCRGGGDTNREAHAQDDFVSMYAKDNSITSKDKKLTK